MALVTMKKNEVSGDLRKVAVMLDTKAKVLAKFCELLESDGCNDSSLRQQEVQKYLARYGYVYRKNYRVFHNKWNQAEGPDDNGERFVTHIGYPLMVGVLMSFWDANTVCIVSPEVFDYDSLIPIFEKTIVYLVVDQYQDFHEMLKSGVDSADEKAMKEAEKRVTEAASAREISVSFDDEEDIEPVEIEANK